MNPMLNIAIRAARRAGDIITRALESGQAPKVDSKGHNDFVSSIDRQAEREIIDILSRAYPHHAIKAEESATAVTAANGKKPSFEWVIDPLDGTTNFLYGYPHFAISIALKHNDRVEHAVIYDPLRQELFTASRGQGALFNNRRIRVNNLPSLEGALLGTGFPFKKQHHLDVYLETFKALFPHTKGVRRAGSAALDLAYVAAGRLDGFWEIGLDEWDIAAGTLIVEEAGGLVCDFTGGHNHLNSGNVVAGSPKVLKGILQNIQPHLTDVLKQ